MLALHPWVRAGIGRWREILLQRQFGTIFEGRLPWFCPHLHKYNFKRPLFHSEQYACATISSVFCCQKQFLPHASTFTIFLATLSSSFRHQFTESLKEQMYWRNASIRYLLQFGGVCPVGFLAKGLYVSQEKFTFMREENWGKSLLLDPEVRDTGLLSFCTYEEKAHSYRNSHVSIHPSFFPSVKNYNWNQIFLCQ